MTHTIKTWNSLNQVTYNGIQTKGVARFIITQYYTITLGRSMNNGYIPVPPEVVNKSYFCNITCGNIPVMCVDSFAAFMYWGQGGAYTDILFLDMVARESTRVVWAAYQNTHSSGDKHSYKINIDYIWLEK